MRDMAAVQTSWQTSARRALRQDSQHRHNLAALPSVHRVVTGRARRQRSHHARAGHTATPSRRRPAPARSCRGAPPASSLPTGPAHAARGLAAASSAAHEPATRQSRPARCVPRRTRRDPGAPGRSGTASPHATPRCRAACPGWHTPSADADRSPPRPRACNRAGGSGRRGPRANPKPIFTQRLGGAAPRPRYRALTRASARRSAPASAYSVRRRSTSGSPWVAKASVRAIRTKAGSRRASPSRAPSPPSPPQCLLPCMCPQRRPGLVFNHQTRDACLLKGRVVW